MKDVTDVYLKAKAEQVSHWVLTDPRVKLIDGRYIIENENETKEQFLIEQYRSIIESRLTEIERVLNIHPISITKKVKL